MNFIVPVARALLVGRASREGAAWKTGVSARLLSVSFQNVCVLWETWENWGGREQTPHIPGGGHRSWGTKTPSPCPCSGGHVLAALQGLENSGRAGPGSYCPQHLEKCAEKPEMGKQSKPVTQEGTGLGGAGKAWPCPFQGWGQPASHSMRTDCQAKCTFPCSQLHKVRAKTMVMLRTKTMMLMFGATRFLYQLYLQELQHQH